MTNNLDMPNISIDELSQRLADFLKRSFSAAQEKTLQQVHVRGLRLLTGGASRQTWSFDAVLEEPDGQTQPLPLILRSDPPGGPMR